MKRTDPRNVTCPRCAAKPGEGCVTNTGNEINGHIHVPRYDRAKAQDGISTHEYYPEESKMADNTLMNKYPRDVAVFSDPQEGVKQGYRLLQVLGVEETSRAPYGMNNVVVQAKLKFLMGREGSEQDLIARLSLEFKDKLRALEDHLDEVEKQRNREHERAEAEGARASEFERKLESTLKSNRRLKAQVASLKSDLNA
jgi:DNA polymerase III alpha subunit (gram-positive type)